MEDEVAGFQLKRFLEVAALVNGGAALDWEMLLQRARTTEAFGASTAVWHPERVIGYWLAAALALADAAKRPSEGGFPDFDLPALLAWRLAVLGCRGMLGRAVTERLLAEGGRSLATLPYEPSPPGASRWGRIRRGAAGRVSRTAFLAWRAAQRG